MGNFSLRKHFRNIIKLCKDYHIWEAKNGFLRSLIENNIVTNHYRVRNRGNDNQTDAAIKTSLEWMKDDLRKNESREYELLNKLTDEYNSFVTLIPPT